MKIRASIIAATALLGMSTTTPAHATWWLLKKHKHVCHCGHTGGGCGGTTSSTSSTTGGTTTSGGTTSTSGGTTTSTTSGGSTSSTTGGTTTSTTSGGSTTSGSPNTVTYDPNIEPTSVPEPGMLGMMALGLLGIGFARSRKGKPRA